MQLDQLKRKLQEHLTDGTVLVIGSGLSASLGVSTMPQLAAYLSTHVPRHMVSEAEADWLTVSKMLEAGSDLESALNSVEICRQLEETIVHLTAGLISADELAVVKRVIEGHSTLPLSQLLKRLTVGDEPLPVVTTNYDRLVELAAESIHIGVDLSFFGHVHGNFDPRASREAMGFAAQTQKGRSLKRIYRRHIKLLKPHGSLDWFVHDGSPIRSPFALDLPRLMVPPGRTKYRKGYEQPFDYHRDAANAAIDTAARFIVIGFGFNDPHLQSHLLPKVQQGAPCLILTKQLTPEAHRIVETAPAAMALSEFVDIDSSGTKLTLGKQRFRYDNIDLWNLESFLAEVF